MKFLLFFLIAGSFPALALETDNYLSWAHPLPDSNAEINGFIKSQIDEALSSAPRNLSCKKITNRIAERFKTSPKGEVFVNWSTSSIPDHIYPSSDHYIEQSIYRKTPSPLLKVAPLAPNIQVDGIYFGLDKLSHFSSTGRRYLNEYLKRLKKGDSPEEAERGAIRLGLSNEAGILGIWASGVFSYGDVEANFQGLQFYKKFCLDTQDAYLQRENGRWILVRVPDIKDYISPAWDETFNLSYSESQTLKRTSRVIQEEYCHLKDSPVVAARFAEYRKKNRESVSMKYIRDLQERGSKKTPIPEVLCN